ncbi:uncharacterized protein LOC133366938 [Rhineura floridana]|uniref:uncharacterized protein LOC133366938 n=1 Tax=Rhineura floridana TaxID=261503 RepID=UPI002AC844CE|nr:uncharacterized protein LOC133366938 [Rhineura floridana]
MSLLWTWPVLIVGVLKGSVGLTVSQTEGIVSVTQGERISLNCSYDVTVYSIFWYIQHPSQPPKLFLRDIGKDDSDEGHLQGFKAEHVKEKKTFDLEKSASQLSDSAVYFCAATDTLLPLPSGSLGRAQKINQTMSAVAFDGASHSLTCTLSSVTTEMIQWYWQFPGERPQYIGGTYPGDPTESADPKSTVYFAKDKKSSTLLLHDVTLAEAAFYFCALNTDIILTMISMSVCMMFLAATLKGTVGQSVDQTEGTVVVNQGDPIFLHCSYKSSGIMYPFWYVQHPNQPPRLFLRDIGKEDLDEGHLLGFIANHDENQKTFNITKPESQLSDSAVYFCAPAGSGQYIFGSGTKLVVIPGQLAFLPLLVLRGVTHSVNNAGWTVIFGSGTKLVVLPDLNRSEPSVYTLYPDEEKDKEAPPACLVTDYFPAPISVGRSKDHAENVNGSVIVVKESENDKGTPSYGTVVWDASDKDFECYVNYNGQIIDTKKADSADMCLGEKTAAFETDERLNLLSVTVLGLRVIFLKSVAFNLLLTFHLWLS